LLALCACATGVHGLPDQPVLGDYALKQRVFELKSGMRVIVQENHNTPNVTFRFRVGAGGTSDPLGKEGIAHLVEHLAFRNKPGGGEIELWDLLVRMAGNPNAFTRHDVTEYFETVSRERLNDLMQLEAWRLSHLLDGVTDEVFQVEREVVRNELRSNYELRARVLVDVYERLYPKGHPLHRSVIGTHESLKSITLDDVRAFVKKHYTPNNITLVIAGNLSPDMVQKELGRWPAELLFGPGGPTGAAVAPQPRIATLPRPTVPAPVDTRLATVVRPVLEPLLVIAWSAPAAYRGDMTDSVSDFAEYALNFALAVGIERKAIDPIESVSAEVSPGKDGTIFAIVASLRPDADPEEQRTRILDAVAETWAGDSAELGGVITESAKWEVATNMLRSASDLDASSEAVVDYYWQTGDAAPFKQRLERIANVESSDVKQHVYTFLKRERAVSVFFKPEADLLAKMNREGAERSQQLQSSRDVGRHRLGAKASISIAGLGPEAIRKVIAPIKLSSLRQIKLPNGLRFVLLPEKGAPVAEVRLVLPGGTNSVEPLGLANIAKSISFSTCSDYGDLDTVGGTIFRTSGASQSTYHVGVLDGNLVNGLAVLSDAVSCRKASDERHLSLQEALKSGQERFERTQSQVQTKASARFLSELYPNHIYGAPQTSPKQLANISFASMESFVQAHFRPDRALGIIVGDVDEARVRPMIERYFSRWQSGSGMNGHPAPPSPRDNRTIVLYDRPGATQSSFSFGCRLPGVREESLPAQRLLVEIVEEDLHVIREQWGATYGLRASLQTLPPTVASLVAGGSVETSRTVEVVKRLFDNIANIATNGPDIKYFTLKRWDMAVRWNETIHSNEGRTDLLIETERYGFGTQVWDNYGEKLANTTRQQVGDLVKACTGKEIVVVVGDRKLLEPEFAAAGLTITE